MAGPLGLFFRQPRHTGRIWPQGLVFIHFLRRYKTRWAAPGQGGPRGARSHDIHSTCSHLLGRAAGKITILEIKVARLPTPGARANAQKELGLLREIAAPVLAQGAPLAAKLKALNEQLWEIEDRIREHERAGNFDTAFIALARSVYQTNDERGRIKRVINMALGSGLIEEKSYKPY